jgi:hypothetical protein
MQISKGLKTFLIGAALALAGLVSGRAYAISSATLNIDVTVNASAAVSIDSLGVSSTPFIAWSAGVRAYASGDNAAGISFTSATVVNPGNLTEHWYLNTTANSIDASGGGGNTWTLIASSNTTDVNGDQFALQAIFASSATTGGSAGGNDCPGNAAAVWTSSGSVIYTAAQSPITAGDTGNAYGAKNGSTLFNNYVYVSDPAGNACPDTGCLAGKYQMLSNSALPTGSGKRALCWRVILPNSTTATTNQIIPLIVTAQQL